eukprot:8328596-Pyramimonas_sp.AAC.1
MEEQEVYEGEGKTTRMRKMLMRSGICWCDTTATRLPARWAVCRRDGLSAGAMSCLPARHG